MDARARRCALKRLELAPALRTISRVITVGWLTCEKGGRRANVNFLELIDGDNGGVTGTSLQLLVNMHRVPHASGVYQQL